MKEHKVEGLICLKDDLGIEYKVSRIEYIIWENGEFEYRFIPNYQIIDLLDSSVFQGIPGLDLSLRQNIYIRRNRIPVFISERTPAANREDLWNLLEDCDMQYLNPLEWLIKTDTKYIGDRLYVRKDESENVYCLKTVDTDTSKLNRTVDIIRKILDYICFGYDVVYDGFIIGQSNRKDCYNLLYRLYKKETKHLKQLQKDGIEKAKAEGRYRGRKGLQVDDTKLFEVCKKYRNKQISANEAAHLLNMSKSTFFRRLKKTEVNINEHSKPSIQT